MTNKRTRPWQLMLAMATAVGLSTAAWGQDGNGGPSGAHYNLNIIGVPKGKKADMDGNQGHRIFVNLEGKTKILLCEGDFQVLDANGTDKDGAKFQLPAPGGDTAFGDDIKGNQNTESWYSVWVRPLGKPNGSVKITTCATDAIDNDGDGTADTAGEEVCSVLSVVAVRSTSKSRFEDVSKELLYIYADVDGDGRIDRVPLFDEQLKDYFWEYDNSGLKLLQLRFYEIPSEIPDPDDIP